MTYYRQPQQQPSGFYNPWMPGPDIGRGVQGLMDKIQQQKMYQEQLKQQEWKRGITEQEIGQAERGLGLRERELVSREEERKSIAEYRMREPTQIQLAKKLVETEYVDDMGKAMALVMGLQKPEEVLSVLEEELKLKEEYRPKDLFDKRMALGQKLVNKGLLDEGTLGMIGLGVQGLQPSLTPGSIATNRRLIFDTVTKKMHIPDPETYTDPEKVEELSARDGIYLWAPIKYSQILQAQALNPKFVTEEELEYVKQIEYTKAYFDKYLKGTEIPLEALPLEEVEKLDTETLSMLYKIYNPEKRKKILGIF